MKIRRNTEIFNFSFVHLRLFFVYETKIENFGISTIFHNYYLIEITYPGFTFILKLLSLRKELK